MTLSPLHHRAFIIAAAFGLAVSAAGAAQAFTFEDQGASGGGQGFTDLNIPKVPSTGAPDSRFSSDNGLTTYKSGNSSFQFGSRPSFNERYNSNSLFDPYYRDGR
jgi:hypothetical protein